MTNDSVVVWLRAVADSDLPIFFRHQRDPEATAMADFPSRDEAPFMAHWAKILRDEGTINRTIMIDQQVAGNIGSWPHDGTREVGYWLGREFWGRHIATRALAAFLEIVPARPLRAEVVKHNRASQRVLEHCGFVRCGEDDHVFIYQLDASTAGA